jgi:sugar phosphate isomerase/epimerase
LPGQQLGYQGIDIAPGRVFANPFSVTDQEVSEFLKQLRSYGLRVGGMQSLLYRRSDLTIFEDEVRRGQTMQALCSMIDLGQKLGLAAVVFGSPKNRLIGEVTPAKMQIARTFFGELGDYAHRKGIIFALEPNPAIYGGDFLLSTEDVINFVTEVSSPGLKVNLDTGTLIENAELTLVQQLITQYHSNIGHVHLSLPNLKLLVIEDAHQVVLDSLLSVDYQGWIAIEMLSDTQSILESDILDSVYKMVSAKLI